MENLKLPLCPWCGDTKNIGYGSTMTCQARYDNEYICFDWDSNKVRTCDAKEIMNFHFLKEDGKHAAWIDTSELY